VKANADERLGFFSFPTTQGCDYVQPSRRYQDVAMDYFRGKRVFITGGSSGIGEATAIRLASFGAHVYIGARGEGRLDATVAALAAQAQNDQQRFGRVVVDVSDKASVSAAAQEVLDGLGGLDILINNAGIAHPATCLETPDEIFDSMMKVNYFGTVYVTRAFLPHFYAQNSGHIANVASMLGFMGIYGYTAYAASKYAITGFSDSLRQELLDYGVKITVCFPPDTDTPQLHAENEIKPPETKAIAGEVKMMSADAVAMSLLKGIVKGTYHVVPGAMGQFTYFMVRHAPSVVRWVIDGALKKYRRQHPKAA
jgi:3-dehydrosphinganine reductase